MPRLPLASPSLPRFIAALGLALAAPACDPPEEFAGEGELDDELGELDEPRVYGGAQTYETRLDAVPALETTKPSGTLSHCTGTLITEDVVVTAAHCVCSSIDASQCASTSKATFFGLSGEASGPARWGSVVVHPSYYGHSHIQHDIALVLLDMPLGASDPVGGVSPIEVASDSPAVGETLEVVGYGSTNAACNSGSGWKNSADLQVTSTSPTQFQASSAWAGTCQGDSGGPAIDASNRLQGVLSYGQGDASGYMEVDFYRDFLADHACDHDEFPVNMWHECGNALCPCEEGEGDCDTDAECAPGLHCADDVGAEYGLPANADVCEALPSPSLHVEFTGCNFGSPQFLVTWSSTGLAVDSYDLDYKVGFGSYQSYYDGSSSGAELVWGSSNRNDAFRLRVCRGGSCSAFTSRTTGSWSCGGGGVGGGEPL